MSGVARFLRLFTREQAARSNQPSMQQTLQILLPGVCKEISESNLADFVESGNNRQRAVKWQDISCSADNNEVKITGYYGGDDLITVRIIVDYEHKTCKVTLNIRLDEMDRVNLILSNLRNSFSGNRENEFTLYHIFPDDNDPRSELQNFMNALKANFNAVMGMSGGDVIERLLIFSNAAAQIATSAPTEYTIVNFNEAIPKVANPKSDLTPELRQQLQTAMSDAKSTWERMKHPTQICPITLNDITQNTPIIVCFGANGVFEILDGSSDTLAYIKNTPNETRGLRYTHLATQTKTPVLAIGTFNDMKEFTNFLESNFTAPGRNITAKPE